MWEKGAVKKTKFFFGTIFDKSKKDSKCSETFKFQCVQKF